MRLRRRGRGWLGRIGRGGGGEVGVGEMCGDGVGWGGGARLGRLVFGENRTKFVLLDRTLLPTVFPSAN